MIVQTVFYEFLVDPALFLWIIFAVCLGLFFGALPGFSVTSALILILPVIYLTDALPALILVYVMGKSGVFGGSISAIALNIPGAPGSAATLIDGYPMSQKGFGVKAIQIATLSSVIGDLLGDVLLITLVILFINLQLEPGPAELFSIYLCAFACVVSVTAAKPLQGVLSILLGYSLHLIGTNPISHEQRFTFGIAELTQGIPTIPLMIGMFVLAELIWAIGTKPEEKSKPRPKDLTSHEKLKWSECKQCFPVILKSSLIGAIVGALPGVGSTVASFLAYYECKRRAKNKEIWGKGAIEGVAAAEAANNAVSGPSLGLLLTLGIPGGSIGIILGSVLIFYNIELGQVFPQSTNVLIYQLVFSGFIGITIYGLLGFFGAPHLYRFVKSIPKNILYPIVFLSTFVSAYLYRGEIFDVLIMLLVGFGTVMLGKHEFNRAAFIITFVLADGLESSFRAVIERDDLGLFLFLERPIAPILLAIASAGFLFAIRNLYKQYFITRHGTVRRTRTRL